MTIGRDVGMPHAIVYPVCYWILWSRPLFSEVNRSCRNIKTLSNPPSAETSARRCLVRALLLVVFVLTARPGPGLAEDTDTGPGPAAARRQNQSARSRVKTLEVVVLSTMLTDRAGVGEWGFSALVEADGHRILFDTGRGPRPCCRTRAS